jgi:hypothetical protein
MPNNLTANVPFSGTAGVAANFSDIAAITPYSIAIIFKVGSPLKSYVPGRAINGITAFEKGAGYYIMPLQSLDLTNYFLKQYDMQTLTDAATIVWNLSAGTIAHVSISAVRNITISNVQNGDTGILQVEHASGSTTINLPGTLADGFAWKTGSGQTTVVGFIYTTGKGFLWFNDGFATT